MIKILNPLPKSLTVACSGGVDSMAIADFLRRKHQVKLAYFHHGTEECGPSEEVVRKYAIAHGLPLVTGALVEDRAPGQSLEEYWRTQRYNFLDTIPGTVVTAHTLNDCVETYLWSCMHGNPKVIPETRGNVVRPFLTTTKATLVNWATRHAVPWYEAPSNANVSHMRNYVRHELLPHALHVNPGLFKLVKKIVESRNSACAKNQPV